MSSSSDYARQVNDGPIDSNATERMESQDSVNGRALYKLSVVGHCDWSHPLAIYRLPSETTNMHSEQTPSTSAQDGERPNGNVRFVPTLDPSRAVKIVGLTKVEPHGCCAVILCDDGKECHVPYSYTRRQLVRLLLDMFESDLDSDEGTKHAMTKEVMKGRGGDECTGNEGK
uniref:Uncharacterized protein n=1 Tax=Trichuris muris TaxID=70415 RepID=A0A5S6QCH3_TRIMR